MTTTKELRTTYNVVVTIPIPDSIPLLSVKENKQGAPWSWWVLWGDLHYLDADGKEHVLKDPHCDIQDYANWKRPDDVELLEVSEGSSFTAWGAPAWEEEE